MTEPAFVSNAERSADDTVSSIESNHLKVTLPPVRLPVPEDASNTANDNLLKPGSSTSLSKLGHDADPDKLSPRSSSSRLNGGLKRGYGSGTRLAAVKSNESDGPVSPHRRHISEGGIPASGSLPETSAVGRKSVQFIRDVDEDTDVDTSRPPSIGGDNQEQQGRGHSLYSRLKAIATNQSFTHGRSTSAVSAGNEIDTEGAWSPRVERDGPYFPMTLEEDDSEAHADAEAEDSTAENGVDQTAPRKRRRKFRRRKEAKDTASPSPHSPMRPGFLSQQTTAVQRPDRPQLLGRSVTENDISTTRAGMSEDEGRRRMAYQSPSSIRTAWLNTIGQRKSGDAGNPDNRRPPTLRGLTTIASRAEPGEDGETPKTGTRRRDYLERGTTLGAQKWKAIRNNFKFQRSTKKDRTVDHEKSAELLAELGAGAPAAVMLASMFQRDERGNKRIPVLLEQLKVRISDSEHDARDGKDTVAFRIELEYGNGINRMKWVVRRQLRDFVQLHSKYKAHFLKERSFGHTRPNAKKMPRFPRSAFPFLGDSDDSGEEEEEEAANDTETPAVEGTATTPNTKRRPSFGFARRKSNAAATPAGDHDGDAASASDAVAAPVKRDNYSEKQRLKLEAYLRKMVRFFLFRADSSRLCKFLEISALGMRLAAEGSYHGKEGLLTIQSAKGLDFRKALTISNITSRHTPKWFLVRHSYVVCVDSPEEMHIYDVFLFDRDFAVQPQQEGRLRDKNASELARSAKDAAKFSKHLRLKLNNSERQLKLFARTARQLQQFEDSLNDAMKISPWVKPNRFDSFAPVRPNCFAQWLVDGRDHMWVLSRAINQAKDVIYIHDWWLSPELYLRRPAAISQKWRLDRLLKRKAEEGVRIFVIVYRNIESAVPIDSQYTKFSLLDLHPNVYVQRSPNQFRQNTFFWAHHEKLCIIDHTLAFVGGIDLCFGRWDTPQHTVTDDKPTGFETDDQLKDAEHCQLWPGKDYSNPRVQDFYALNKPFEEMYNRAEVARMPWHDISMQVVGQPARDLTRHFVQRWNYILRQRKPTRPTPFLLPPPDFNPADLEALGLDGTCEVQILRSSGPWSIGFRERTEHSIMNAYVKMIEESEHFVYIENQFFISSCVTEGATITNLIGDALVERASRAAKNDEDWRAVIIIPLIPGFQNTVEQEGGTSVRLIMQYQYRSICRGESSIFGRLKAQGIEPQDYIRFYALRQWGKIGRKKMLVTEQLYIHAKCMVVDDRIAIIGSANINERSMLGNRDSECAAVVRDTDMIESHMNGMPYKVGRFPHTLRMRLMREHLGLDVDEIMEDAQIIEAERQKAKEKERALTPEETESQYGSPVSATSTVTGLASLFANVNPTKETSEKRVSEIRGELLQRQEELSSFNHDADWEQEGNPNLKSGRKLTADHRVTGNLAHKEDVLGDGFDKMNANAEAGYGDGRDTTLVPGNKEVLVMSYDTEGKSALESPTKRGEMPRMPTFIQTLEAPNPPMPPKPSMERMTTAQLGLSMLSQLPALPVSDDTDIGGPALPKTTSKGPDSHPLVSELRRPQVDRYCMQDPMHDAFFFDTWNTIAENNTKIYRTVFRCMPDNEVKDWAGYHEYEAYEERFNHMQGSDSSGMGRIGRNQAGSVTKSGPPGAGSGLTAASISAASNLPADVEKVSEALKDKVTAAIGSKTKAEEADAEKEKLRKWAAEANEAQMSRQERRLSKQDTFPRFDEKAVPLDAVPEDSESPPLAGRPPTAEGETGDESISTEKATSSPSTAVPASEGTPPIQFVGYSEALNMNAQPRRRRRGTTKGSGGTFKASDDIPSVDEAEELLGMVQGHLVEWPYQWLERVEANGNWLFPLDQITPIEIYV
jgi:phospholipase D1/2